MASETITIELDQPAPDESKALDFGEYFVDRGIGHEYAHLLVQYSKATVWFPGRCEFVLLRDMPKSRWSRRLVVIPTEPE